MKMMKSKREKTIRRKKQRHLQKEDHKEEEDEKNKRRNRKIKKSKMTKYIDNNEGGVKKEGDNDKEQECKDKEADKGSR